MSSTAAEDESAKRLEQPCDIDDTSDYFADVETSSCGSSAHCNMWTNMSPMIQGTFHVDHYYYYNWPFTACSHMTSVYKKKNCGTQL